MFALRGIAVSLTFFVLVYCLLSALVAVAWRSLKWLHASEPSLAGLLFALRVLPMAASVVVTFAFVVPSFQLLEPRSVNIDEGIGRVPFALGLCALFLIAGGCFRVITAQRKTSRVVAGWLEGANPLTVDAAIPNQVETQPHTVAFGSRRETPPLTLVGLRRPRVLISESAVALLSHDELHIALKHELAHIRYPGMSKLESAWSEAAELAADDAAVSNLDDAVDLAAALVKLSRLVAVEVAPVCTVGIVTGSISARVARLLAWDEARKAQTMRVRTWYALPPMLVTLLCVFATYGPALTLTHEITEWLVR
jgi:Zn-dependent protease with chaperone function